MTTRHLGSFLSRYSSTSAAALALVALACSASPSSDELSGGPKGGAGGTKSPSGSGGAAPSFGGNGGTSSSGAEKCDGLDNNGDGKVDAGCACVPGTTQSCFPFDPKLDATGICARGKESCGGNGELGTWGDCLGASGPEAEICGNGIDEDCDGSDLPCDATGGAAGAGGAGGAAGAGGAGAGGAGGSGGGDVVCQNINLFGDCLTVSCPAANPYPKSCQVFFTPGDDRGCVASTPSSSTVYFQAGDQCNAGFVSGTLCCATTPQAPLDQQNCPINKPVPIHVTSSSSCPTLH